MVAAANSFELRCSASDYGLSARRLWVNTELGQINPFGRAISERPELNDAAVFIDVIRSDGDTFALSGLSLAQLIAGGGLPNCSIADTALIGGQISHPMELPLFNRWRCILRAARFDRLCGISTLIFCQQHAQMMFLG